MVKFNFGLGDKHSSDDSVKDNQKTQDETEQKAQVQKEETSQNNPKNSDEVTETSNTDSQSLDLSSDEDLRPQQEPQTEQTEQNKAEDVAIPKEELLDADKNENQTENDSQSTKIDSKQEVPEEKVPELSLSDSFDDDEETAPETKFPVSDAHDEDDSNMEALSQQQEDTESSQGMSLDEKVLEEVEKNNDADESFPYQNNTESIPHSDSEKKNEKSPLETESLSTEKTEKITEENSIPKTTDTADSDADSTPPLSVSFDDDKGGATSSLNTQNEDINPDKVLEEVTQKVEAFQQQGEEKIKALKKQIADERKSFDKRRKELEQEINSIEKEQKEKADKIKNLAEKLQSLGNLKFQKSTA